MSGGAAPNVHPIRPGGGVGQESELWVVGVSHHTAPVELREKLAFAEEQLGEASRRLLEKTEGATELALVSTCNRVEVVALAGRGGDFGDRLGQALAHERMLSPTLVAQHLYAHRGKHAVRHLFRVASSLDSMVVGEPQILGQMKLQFRLSADSGAARRVLRHCFERSFRAAKRIRTETGIATKAVSVSSAAVDLARRIFDDLGGKTAMLLGAGKMSELAARHLQAHGIASVIVSNRSFDRAVELARTFAGTPVPFDRFPQYLHLADVVLGSVAATSYIVGPSHLYEVLRARRRRPMFFIDLGVPRNFDPAINDLESVYLYNIDDLARVADGHRAERAREAARAEEIIDEEVERFWRWISGQDLTPTIVALRGKLDGIRRAELGRALGAIRKLEPEERQALEAMTQAIVNKILHAPVSLLKEAARSEAGTAVEVADLVHRLFALEPSFADADASPAALRGGRDDPDDEP